MDPKKTLQELIQKIQTKNFREGEAKGLLEQIQAEQTKALKPVLESMATEMSDSVMKAINDGFANVKVNVPETKTPDVSVDLSGIEDAIRALEIPKPTINVQAPTVNIPEQKAPVVNMPEIMKILGSVELSGVDKKNPLPVIMMGLDGKPATFSFGGGGSGGGKTDFFTILGIQSTIGASLVDSQGNAYSGSNPLPISGSLSTTPFATYFASDAALSTNMYQIGGNAVAVDQGVSNTGTQRVVQATDVGVSVNIASQAVTLQTQQVSGASDSVNVVGFSASVASIPTNNEGIPYNSDNPLPVTFSAAATQAISIPSLESPLNSSTANLGISGVFTGLAEDIKDYATSQVYVFADVASATDGLSVQQSSNGTNWDITDTFTIPASTGKTFSFQVVARYFRIVYTNGGTGQGAFRLYTVHHKVSPKGSSQRPQDALSNENDFEQISSFLHALNPSGTWDRLRSQSGDSTGALRVTHATDVVVSVNVTGASGSMAVVNLDRDGNPSAGWPVYPVATGTNETNNNVLRAILMSDTISSMNIMQWGGSAVATGLNENSPGVLKVAMITSVVESVNVSQWNGSTPATGLNETNNGVIRAVQMTDSVSSVYITGAMDSFAVWEVMTTNKTAKSDGADIRAKADKVGRQVMRPIQVRDLIATAYVSVANGTETTLLAAGGAGVFNDLIMITATNNSTAAVQVDIRDVTGGNIVHTMYLPASTGPVGFSPAVPLPQGNANNNWTVDLPDITGTTVYFTALFSKEV